MTASSKAGLAMFRDRGVPADRAPLGAALRQLRLDGNLTLRAVATRAGVAHSMVSHLEHGRRNVTLDTLAAVAQAVGARMVVTVQAADPGADAEPAALIERLGPVLSDGTPATRWAAAVWVAELERRRALTRSA